MASVVSLGALSQPSPGLDTHGMFPRLLVPATLWDARINQTPLSLLS